MIKKIAREDNFLSLTGNLVIAILGIGGFALLARSLSLDVFGEWVLFITGGSFVEMFRFGITNTGLIRFLSGADEASRTKLIGSNALIGLGVHCSRRHHLSVLLLLSLTMPLVILVIIFFSNGIHY